MHADQAWTLWLAGSIAAGLFVYLVYMLLHAEEIE
ncbi:MAG: potassium-transporting ATPase subunit F [Laribacter sp.]|nr:potassium-transporting ATPase subunit F [Laribacter sp.]MBP9526789.1 potassium-transporting ATPase subunit F [Laribacter sp.]MBP9608500.1 potassium-transporting ATPase subunit F [Laribacter sp.]